jgi:peroxiredoxin
MKTTLLASLALAVAFAGGAIAQDTAKPADKHDHKHDHPGHSHGKAEVGQPAPNFTLKTVDGKEWSLSDAKGKLVVLEWINPECPVCVRVMSDGTVAKTLSGVKEIYPDAVYVAVNSSAARQSSLDGTGEYMKAHKMDLPALLDSDGAVGKMYGAKTTPHCYVISPAGTLVYAGAIDDGANGGAKMNYVVNAAKQLKAGETVSPGETKPYGCSVKYKKG